MQNYTYLRPSSRMIKSSSITTHYGQSGEREIFTGRDNRLTSEQKEAVNTLKEYLTRKNQNREFQQGLLLRYCYLCKMSVTDAVKKFKYYDDWWEMPPIVKNKQKGILHSGVFYCYGRDDGYSPNIYFHPMLINLDDFTIEDFLVSLRTLLTPIEKQMLVEGKIEKWNVIVDIRAFNEKKLKDNYAIYLNNIRKICYSYPQRLKRLFLIVPGAYTGLWSKVNFFSNSTKLSQQMIAQLQLQQKCIKIDNLQQLDRYIPAQQRQRQYGGTLEDLSQFWPIITTNKLMEVNSRFVEGSEDSETYNSIANDQNQSFFAEKQQKTTRCRCSIQ